MPLSSSRSGRSPEERVLGRDGRIAHAASESGRGDPRIIAKMVEVQGAVEASPSLRFKTGERGIRRRVEVINSRGTI